MADTTTGPATAAPDQADGAPGPGSALEGMGDCVRGAAEAVQQGVQGTTGDAMRRAREAAGRTGGDVRRRVDQGSTRLGDRVTQSADDIRSVGDHLRGQGRPVPADLADQLAGRAEAAGRYLQDADSGRLLGDFERFGRQRPWAVALAGVVVGLVGARLLKASEQRRAAERQGRDRPGVHPGAASVTAGETVREEGQQVGDRAREGAQRVAGEARG